MTNSRHRQHGVRLISAKRLAMLLAAACLAPAAVHADATPTPNRTAFAVTTAAPGTTTIKLATNEQLAHKVVSGPLGPWSTARVWLTQSSEVDDAPYSGRVVAPDGTVHALPPPDEPESAFMMKVRSVIFRNVDHSAERELIVLYSAARIGPQQAPYYAACVYKWNGSAFTRLAPVEAKLGGAKTSADVSKRLAGTAGAGKGGSGK